MEGQQQAIFVAENPTINGQIAGLEVMKNGAWTLAFRTKADDHAIADIAAYTKTSTHLQGQSCMASGAAVGNALAGIIAPYVGALWPVDTGGYRFTVIDETK